jgi:hypothetical protein
MRRDATHYRSAEAGGVETGCSSRTGSPAFRCFRQAHARNILSVPIPYIRHALASAFPARQMRGIEFDELVLPGVLDNVDRLDGSAQLMEDQGSSVTAVLRVSAQASLLERVARGSSKDRSRSDDLRSESREAQHIADVARVGLFRSWRSL